MKATESLRARALVGPYALIWFYRRWLRVHAVQELLAGLGVAIAVALMFATIVAAESVAGGASEIVHTVVGPATLQLHARDPEGMPGGLLGKVKRLPGVKDAAPLVEQPATVQGPGGRQATVDLAGADLGLVFLDGLAHTIPRETLSARGIGLSSRTAARLGLGLGAAEAGARVRLEVRGRALELPVSAVLGREAFGALSEATVAVMQLHELQRLAGLGGRISRILVEPRRGRTDAVRGELRRLAGERADVADADEDVGLLQQALRPSDEASAFFATISGLLAVLLAAGALLLTAPARRRMIAELRLMGTRRSAIVQIFVFQAIVLGLASSLLGALAGYGLSLGLLQRSPRYLAEAFTLGQHVALSVKPLVIALLGGIAATCLAATIPLLDLRRQRSLDGVYRDEGVPGNALGRRARRRLGLGAAALLVAASTLFAVTPGLALLACALLAVATVLTVPVALAGVMRICRLAAERRQTLTVLPVALSSLRASTVRSLALAATGSVALFGSVALGGARGDLADGIGGFAAAYARDAAIWVSTPNDYQAVVDFRSGSVAARIARLPGVAAVRRFDGSFMQLHGRRVWVIARPPGAAFHVLTSELAAGSARLAEARLRDGGWVVVSEQIAEQAGRSIGQRIAVPTPSGLVAMRIAALSTNLAWSPGVIFIGGADYSRLWRTDAPTALGITLASGADGARVLSEIDGVLRRGTGLTAQTASTLRSGIDSLTEEGLRQLEEISTLLLVAAILAMAAALTSAIWQRRAALAGLRLSGVTPARLRRILLVESALMLGAGCVTGAVAGVYGQAVIDRYLAHVTGFPVANIAAGARPIEIFALVVVVVLVLATAPALLASQVSPRLAFNE